MTILHGCYDLSEYLVSYANSEAPMRLLHS